MELRILTGGFVHNGGLSVGDWIAIASVMISMVVAFGGGFLKVLKELNSNTLLTRQNSEAISEMKVSVAKLSDLVYDAVGERRRNKRE